MKDCPRWYEVKRGHTLKGKIRCSGCGEDCLEEQIDTYLTEHEQQDSIPHGTCTPSTSNSNRSNVSNTEIDF
jgi:hypothetical protein